MKSRYISVRIILLSFVFIFLSQAHGYAQVVQWAKSGGGTDNEYSSAITADANGNIYTIGTFFGHRGVWRLYAGHSGIKRRYIYYQS